MLGRTASGLYWMYRYLERCENTARLLDAGSRIAYTRRDEAHAEWGSLLNTTGSVALFQTVHDTVDAGTVIDFLLREKTNPSSVLTALQVARNNARGVRTALTRELWEAVNEAWLAISDALARPVAERNLPGVLALIRRHTALVRGVTEGTMLRNDIFDFIRLGTFMERADNTARILDVKYYVLLPSVSLVGSTLDNVQWETILRSVSAYRAFKWLYPGRVSAPAIADFLIYDGRMPRSLVFCYGKIVGNLEYLATDYGAEGESLALARAALNQLRGQSIDTVLREGLHELLLDFLQRHARLGAAIETEYRFVS